MKKTRSLFSLLMAIVMMAMSPQRMWAIGGSGTSSSPYTIANASDLVAFASKVNGSEQGAYAKLTADITLTSAWTAMGTSSKPYTGTFDGQGHTISGFSMEGYTKVNAGFFGYVNGATIKNFTLNGTMTSSTQITSGENDCSGAVVGRAMGSSTIQDIVSNVKITLTKAQKHLGGVVGAIEGSTVVKGCTYTGTLDAGPSTDCIGGIVGFAPASCSGSIFYCFFNGTLSSSSSTPTMGGILGYTNDESNNFSGVHDCYSCGTFSFGASDYKYVNAIVGRIRNRATTTINNTYLSGIATRACNTDGPTIPTSNKAITISVTAGTGGKVSQSYVNPNSTTATHLQVVATPNAHYHFGSWSDSGAQTHNVGLTANVSLSASFAIDQHTITVNVANGQSSMGTVTGGGTFNYNSTKTIKATPNTGYHFVQWNDGNTNASRTITVNGNASYTATFAPNQYTITVKTKNATTTGGGTYNYGSVVTISVTPNEHYHFVYWLDDPNASISRQITVTEDKTYYADIQQNHYTLTTNVNNSQYGSVTGNGAYWALDQVTIRPEANDGYHFVNWSDGNTDNPRTITMTRDLTLTANFAPDNYTITVQANDSSLGNVTGGGVHAYGAKVTLTATPNSNAVFSRWSDGNYPASRQITVTEDATYTAEFTPKTAKAVYENYTLTFYYDAVNHSGTMYALNSGANYPEWVTDIDVRDNITSVVFDPSFDVLRPTSCFGWFNLCSNLSTISGLKYLHTDEVTTMSKMFFTCSRLTSLDLSSFNTAKVTNMKSMFSNCSKLSSLNLSSFNTANVTDMNNMFYNSPVLRSLDLRSFNTAKVEDMHSMFDECSQLQSINLSSFNTANVTNMSSMFNDCSALQSLDLSNFNTSSVQDMGQMFSGCSALNDLTIGKFDMQNVTHTTNMFLNCSALNTLTMKSIPFLADKTFNTQFSGDGKTVNVILDDNSEIYTDGTNNLLAATSATFNREIVADGGMYSFIVPFDIPAGQAAELGKFYQYSSHDPEERKVYFDDIAEVSEGVVKANTAYFFKPARDITSFTVNNPSIPRTLTIPDPENPSVPGLYGTYSQIEVPVGAYGYAMHDGQSTFVKAGTGNLLRSFRAYLWLGSGASMAKALAFFGDYDDITGINNIETDSDLDMSKPIYTLSGQRIMTPKKGEIYIQNGKKVIKK